MANEAREQLVRDAIKANKVDKERAEAFSALVVSEGWKFYTELLNYNIAQRTSTLFEPLKSGERDSSEHNKGAVYALIYARDLPQTIVVAMEELAKSSSEPAGDN